MKSTKIIQQVLQIFITQGFYMVLNIYVFVNLVYYHVIVLVKHFVDTLINNFQFNCSKVIKHKVVVSAVVFSLQLYHVRL